MIKTLDEVRASAEMEIFREVEEEDKVIDRIVSVQREIAGLEDEAERVAEEAIELAGEVSF